MAKQIVSNEKKEQKPTNISIGSLSCTIEFNSTYTDAQATMIKSKMVLAMTEALNGIS